MPRHNQQKNSSRRSSSPPERASSGPRRRGSSKDTDAQSLELREKGNSFSAIARTLGFDRATEAQKSYVRALSTHEGEERRRLVKNEEVRLDELEQRIRERDAADVEKVERRLRGVKKLRESIST
jgi:hypothetical protein